VIGVRRGHESEVCVFDQPSFGAERDRRALGLEGGVSRWRICALLEQRGEGAGILGAGELGLAEELRLPFDDDLGLFVCALNRRVAGSNARRRS
jgi:hypothetical protein